MEWVRRHPAVQRWLDRIAPRTRETYLSHIYRYFQWLRENGGEFRDKSPEELIDLQAEALGRRRYDQLELLQRWILSLDLRVGTKRAMYSAVRSFYAHNRAPLPRDPSFRIRSETPPVEGRLDVEGLRKIVLASNTAYQAVFLIMFQGAMGCSEFEYFNLNSWPEVKPQLEDEKPIRISLPGRKHGGSYEHRPYYTFIGRDAREALKRYLESERGVIREGEPIFINKKGAPIQSENIRKYFSRKAMEVGVIRRFTPRCPECGDETIRSRRRVGPREEGVKGPRKTKIVYICRGCGAMFLPGDPRLSEFREESKKVRYGVNPHEMRDLFRSEWETSPAKGIVAEFLMGHDVDPNNYNKFFRDEEYVRRQYMTAEPYLNILSEDPRKVSRYEVIEIRRELDRLREENQRLREELESQNAFIGEFMKALEQPHVRESFLKWLRSLAEKE
ncbi:hypothetical protein J7L60_02005 [Candidatus Bathyarchaeota archaeon]|nr:hypothetical protein [Candidatus Bathyarchaeota archaeon]